MVGRPGNEAKAFPLSNYCILYISNQHLGWWEGLGTRLFDASVSTCFFCALKASLTASWSRFESFLFFWLFLRCWRPSFRVRTVSSSTRLMVPSPNHSTQNWGEQREHTVQDNIFPLCNFKCITTFEVQYCWTFTKGGASLFPKPHPAHISLPSPCVKLKAICAGFGFGYGTQDYRVGLT